MTEGEGDRHGCCCEHVVDELQAMPAPEEERLSIVRDRLYACPHGGLSPLEMYVMSLREEQAMTDEAIVADDKPDQYEQWVSHAGGRVFVAVRDHLRQAAHAGWWCLDWHGDAAAVRALGYEPL